MPTLLAKTNFLSVALTQGQTTDVTDVGFEPKALVFAWSTWNADQWDPIQYSLGYFVPGDQRACGVTFRGATGLFQANINGYRQHRDDAVMVALDADGNDPTALPFGVVGVTQTLENGFRLKCIKTTLTYNFNYFALGGDAIANAAVGTISCPAATGAQSITVGFQPTVVLFMSVATTASPVTGEDVSTAGEGHSTLSFGAAGGSANYVTSFYYVRKSDSLPTDTGRYCKNGQSIALMNSTTSVVARGRVTAWTSLGFTITWDEVSSGMKIHYLALDTTNAVSLGDFMTPTNTNPFQETGVGFRPKALIVSGHGIVESTNDVPQTHAGFSLGWTDSPTRRYAHYFMSEDNNNAMSSPFSRLIRKTRIYGHLLPDASTANPPSIATQVDLTQMLSDGWEGQDVDTPDSTAAFAWYVAFPTLDTGETPLSTLTLSPSALHRLLAVDRPAQTLVLVPAGVDRSSHEFSETLSQIFLLSPSTTEYNAYYEAPSVLVVTLPVGEDWRRLVETLFPHWDSSSLLVLRPSHLIPTWRWRSRVDELRQYTTQGKNRPPRHPRIQTVNLTEIELKVN